MKDGKGVESSGARRIVTAGDAPTETYTVSCRPWLLLWQATGPASSP
jgi:hypothetical protein